MGEKFETDINHIGIGEFWRLLLHVMHNKLN